MNEKLLQEIKESGRERKIPIIMDVTLEYIYDILKDKNVNNILEIGSAIGYSAICFSKLLKENGHIDTIEIEEIRVEEARKNIKNMKLDNNVTVHLGNALDILPKFIKEGKKYDYIFIDAAKGKYLDFYNYSLDLLSDDGIIIADNVLYKGMVLSDYNQRKHRTAVNKLRYFINYIQNIDNIKSEIIDVGDGISISYRR